MFFWIRLETIQPILTRFFLYGLKYRRIFAKTINFVIHPYRKWENWKNLWFWTVLVAPLYGKTAGWIIKFSFVYCSAWVLIELKTIAELIWPSQRSLDDIIREELPSVYIPGIDIPYVKTYAASSSRAGSIKILNTTHLKQPTALSHPSRLENSFTEKVGLLQSARTGTASVDWITF